MDETTNRVGRPPLAANRAAEKPLLYDEKIRLVWNELCEENGDGASPSEVTARMHTRGWLSPMDTVIDIERLMRGLRDRGLL